MKIFYLFILLSYSFTYSQQPFSNHAEYNPLQTPNTYRNGDNPSYWNNRPPYKNYWQQDVYYYIQAEVNENTDIISGYEELTYWNNSPDTLTHVYFHLYQNAFQPESYYHKLHKENDVTVRFGRYENINKGTEIISLTVNGEQLALETDNTVMKVLLSSPLPPKSIITFEIEFKTYFDFGSMRRRMDLFNAYGYKHYNGVHWYPRISVYDSKFGWTTDQHLGREFYGDFGTFDVELTFANNFIVGATGFLTNRDEVLPKDLRDRLDIKNFKDKPWEESPSVIIEYHPEEKKTWKYHAENVHDFAFTADPTYRIGEAQWNGITCYSLAQEPHAAKWQNAADYAARVIQVYSEDFGMYTYHKMIVADARDGMEYPMITLDNGKDPTYKGLLAHEIGHNWFFGQVGSNETYRAMLDEGFTQFLTAWALTKIEGDTLPGFNPQKKYYKKFKKPDMTMESRVYRSYIYDAVKLGDATLNTHSDGYNGALRHGGGYSNVYYKTATMLFNLQYVLGDDLFLKAMQNYFNRWKICHPYIEDFRNSVIQYTHVDLNWFFDQWIETSKSIDYGIKSVKKGNNNDEYIITFIRKERMQMPVDFSVISKNNEHFNFYIPNTWFEKNTTATILPRWIGWDLLQPTYEAVVTIPGGIKDVMIDPSNRLADIYLLDNYKKLPISFEWDHQLNNFPDRRNYEIFARPDLWYNAYDGLKAGFHINSSYLNYFHVFDAYLWFNTGMFQGNIDTTLGSINNFDAFSFSIKYNTQINKLGKNTRLHINAKKLDGLHSYHTFIEKTDQKEKNSITLGYKFMYRSDNDIAYLLYPEEWKPNLINATIIANYNHKYWYNNGMGNIDLNLKSSTIGSDYSFAQLSLEAINTTRSGRFIIKTRTFAQLGTGNNIPDESALYLSGANPENMMDNKYTRSSGFFSGDWLGYGDNTNHFQAGGGLNLRGYAGYLAPFEDKNGEVHYTYKGNSGAALNIEVEFDKYLNLNPGFLKNVITLNTYLFADAGMINYNAAQNYFSPADFRMDAGLGTALTITKWGPFKKVKPLTVRADFPLFLNKTPYVSTEYIQFRWAIGINRAF